MDLSILCVKRELLFSETTFFPVNGLKKCYRFLKTNIFFSLFRMSIYNPGSCSESLAGKSHWFQYC